MMRLVFFLTLLATSVSAQSFVGLARVSPEESQLIDTDDGLQLDLKLSQVVPYRVFTLEAPARLVLDFREVDWAGLDRLEFDQSELADAVNFGLLRPGWSRMVVQLANPALVKEAGIKVDDADGSAQLRIVLETTSEEAFKLASKPPELAGWDNLLPSPILRPKPRGDGPLIVVIDPGHGGIDPGAEHGGETEADLMLKLGIEVAEALNRVGGIEAILTRETDVFVPLQARITIARQSHADLMISLHADALSEGQARGGSVYTLSADAADLASRRMAERHERGDLIAGLDLTEQDDRVATVLMDLARAQTGPQGQRFASNLVDALRSQNVRLHRNTLRSGQLAVLNAADFASVLFEVGYMSNDRDRAVLLDPVKRKPIVEAIVAAVVLWSLEEAAVND